MKRIDEKAGRYSEFTQLKDCLVDLDKVIRDKSDMDKKIVDVQSLLRKTNQTVQTDAQATALFKLMIENEPFKNWLSSLPQGYSLLLQSNIEKEFPANTNWSCQDLEDWSSSYAQSAKSLWFETFLNTHPSKPAQEIAYLVETFARQQRQLVDVSAEMPVHLLSYTLSPQMSDEDKAIIKRFETKLFDLKKKYGDLQLENIFVPQNKSLPEVVRDLEQKYSTIGFGLYIHALKDLTEDFVKITAITQKYPNIHSQVHELLGHCNSIATLYKQKQVLGRIDELCRQEHIEDYAAAKDKPTIKPKDKAAQEHAKAYGLLRFYSCMTDSANENQAILAECLLHSDDIKQLPFDSDMENSVQQDTFTALVLSRLNPKIFTVDNLGVFNVNGDPDEISKIYKALGSNATQPLDPAKFCIFDINSLSNEVLRSLLKIMRPLDANGDDALRLVDKVGAYHRILEEIRNQKLSISNASRREQREVVAESVMRMVVNRLDKHPKEFTSDLKKSMHLIYGDIYSGKLVRNVSGYTSPVEAKYKIFNKVDPNTQGFKEFLTKDQKKSFGETFRSEYLSNMRAFQFKLPEFSSPMALPSESLVKENIVEPSIVKEDIQANITTEVKSVIDTSTTAFNDLLPHENDVEAYQIKEQAATEEIQSIKEHSEKTAEQMAPAVEKPKPPEQRIQKMSLNENILKSIQEYGAGPKLRKIPSEKPGANLPKGPALLSDSELKEKLKRRAAAIAAPEKLMSKQTQQPKNVAVDTSSPQAENTAVSKELPLPKGLSFISELNQRLKARPGVVVDKEMSKQTQQPKDAAVDKGSPQAENTAVSKEFLPASGSRTSLFSELKKVNVRPKTDADLKRMEEQIKEHKNESQAANSVASKKLPERILSSSLLSEIQQRGGKVRTETEVAQMDMAIQKGKNKTKNASLTPQQRQILERAKKMNKDEDKDDSNDDFSP